MQAESSDVRSFSNTRSEKSTAVVNTKWMEGSVALPAVLRRYFETQNYIQGFYRIVRCEVVMQCWISSSVHVPSVPPVFAGVRASQMVMCHSATTVRMSFLGVGGQVKKERAFILVGVE